jgi:hypothetical protein
MGQTLVKVQAAHDADDEANKVKKGRNGRHRAEETPLDESPSESPGVEHETPPDKVQSRQNEEHHHGELPLQSRRKPALRRHQWRSAKMYMKKRTVRSQGISNYKGLCKLALGEKMITYDDDDCQKYLIDVRLRGHKGNCAMVKLIKPKSHCSNDEEQLKLNDSG